MDKEDFLKKVEIELKISKNSEYTTRNYIKSNEEFLSFIDKYPKDVTEEDLKFFLSERYSKKSTSSIILFLSAIRYSYLSIFGFDPTQNIKRPKKEKKIPMVLSKNEIKLLINSTQNRKSKLIISLIYACGLRVSELTNLRIADFDFEQNIGKIKQSKGKKDRMFNIPVFLKENLKYQSQEQQKHKKIYLFTGPNGKLTTRNIQKIVKNASYKSKIGKDIHCHTLRHSFATHLLENNVDIRKIQELLGHSDLSTTQIYTHVSNKELRKIASPIDSLY